MQRGVTIRGKVTSGGEPVTRFRVDTRTRDIPKDNDGNVIAADAKSDRGSRNTRGRWGRGRDGSPWGRRGKRTRQLPEGQKMGERGMDGNWREIKSSDGTFELTGIPPGRVRVRVRADGYIEPSNPVSYTHLTLPTICSV